MTKIPSGMLPSFSPRPSASSVTADCCYPSSHPVFAGHYPGFPIVPGNLLLGLFAELAGEEPIRRVSRVRFLKPLFPDQAFEARVEVSDHEELVCTTWRDGEKCCRATLHRDGHLKSPTPPPAPSRPVDDIAITNLLPHREPILLVDRVLRGEEGPITQKDLGATEPLVGEISDYPFPLLLESLAQGAIVQTLTGTNRLARDDSQVFLFAGLREVILGAPVRPGETITHHAQITRDLCDAVILDATAWVGARCAMVATGLALAIRPAQVLEEETP